MGGAPSWGLVSLYVYDGEARREGGKGGPVEGQGRAKGDGQGRGTREEGQGRNRGVGHRDGQGRGVGASAGSNSGRFITINTQRGWEEGLQGHVFCLFLCLSVCLSRPPPRHSMTHEASKRPV